MGSIFDMFSRKPVEAPAPNKTPQNPYGEEGVSGLHVASGYLYEEILRELSYDKGRRVFREMADNDATCGAALTAIDALLRAIKWRVEPNPLDPSGEGSDFMISVMGDMAMSWEGFMSEVLTELIFGWSYFEKVYKKRPDGKIGLAKLAPRAQESLLRWELAETGEVIGMHQQDPNGGKSIFIPRNKALHFRTTSRKDSPEGRSVLRSAFVSWYRKKTLESIEAIAIERELAGLPIVSVPSDILTNPDMAATKARYYKMARDLKYNDQGAVLIPSDTYPDALGKPSNVRMFSIELMSASGSRALDTNAAITRYDQAIARTILADFLILGSSSRGSFALSKSKTDLFLRSLEGFTANIAAELNNDLIAGLWLINGFDPDTKPTIIPGQVAPTDLVELGLYAQQISQAGIPLAGDAEIERKLRQAADLPADYIGDGDGHDPNDQTLNQIDDEEDGPSSGNI